MTSETQIVPVGWSLDPQLVKRTPDASELLEAVLLSEKHTADLKTRINQTVPIGRIPDDVLIAIFYELVCDLFFSSETTTKHGQYPSWLYLASVCRRWNYLVYNTPHLWGLLEWVPNTSRLDAVLKHLKNASVSELRVVYDYRYFGGSYKNISNFTSKGTMKKILREIARARHVELRNAMDSTPYLALTQLFRPPFRAPFLTSLNLTGISIPTIMQTRLPSELPFSNPDMFPRLKSLHIGSRTHPIFFTALAHPNLTSLTLVASQRQFTPESVFGVLVNLPCLVDLSLLWDTDGDRTPRIQNHGTNLVSVALPRLETLRLKNYTLMCTHMLRRMSFPDSTRIDISLANFPSVNTRNSNAKYKLDDLLKRLWSCGVMSSKTVFDAVEVYIGGTSDDKMGEIDESVGVKCWRTWTPPPSDSPEFMFPRTEPSFSLELDFRYHGRHDYGEAPSPIPSLLAMLHEILPLESAKHLLLARIPKLEDLRHLCALKRMQAVECLTFRGCTIATADLFRLLVPASVSELKKNPIRCPQPADRASFPDPLFPNLTRLSFESMCTYHSNRWSPVTSLLCDALDYRKEQKRPISHVSFRGFSQYAIGETDLVQIRPRAQYVLDDFKEGERDLPAVLPLDYDGMDDPWGDSDASDSDADADSDSDSDSD